MNAADIAVAIAEGEADSELDGILEMVKARQQYLAAQVAATIKVGDFVQITGGISPKYLIGQIAEVTGKARTKLVVKFVDEFGAGRFAGGEVKVPQQCVKPADAFNIEGAVH